MTTPTFTLQDSYDIFYWILKEEENVSNYPLSLATPFLNSSQSSICNWVLRHPTTKEQIRKPFLNFLNKEAFFESVQYTTVSAVSSIGAGTLTVDATANFQSTWALLINGNVVTYTGKTTTEFTGCSDIAFPWPAWTRVSQLYVLPSNYGSPSRCVYDWRYEMIPIDQRDVVKELRKIGIDSWGTAYSSWNNLMTQGMYWIIDGTYMAFIPDSITGNSVQLTYQKKATALVNPTDLLTIPDEYSLTTIPYIAVWEMLFNRGEEQRGLELWTIGLNNVKMLYDATNATNKEAIYNVRARTSRDRVVYNI